MIERKKIILDRFVKNISCFKIKKFCELLEQKEIKSTDSFFKIKKALDIDSKEEKYFLELISKFKDVEDLIILIDTKTKILSMQKQSKLKTSLVWSSPIKFHKKISQTYANFLDMINHANNSIIFAGYAMTDDDNGNF